MSEENKTTSTIEVKEGNVVYSTRDSGGSHKTAMQEAYEKALANKK